RVAPTAAAAMAADSIGPENRSRMTASHYLQLKLLQRIGFKLNTLYAVPGSRIHTSPLREGELFDPSSMEQPWEAKVSLDTARLGIESVRLVALPGEFLLGGPGPGPYGRVFDGNFVRKRHRPGPRPALHQVQVFARALKIGLRTEVRNIDHEGVAL